MSAAPAQTAEDNSKSQAQAFLLDLFGDVIDAEHVIAVWDKAANASFHEEIEEAAADLVRRGAARDTYFGACLHDPRLIGPGSRGSASSVSAVCAAYADIDVLGEGKEKAYPPTRAAVLKELPNALPLKPSFIIDSGGGFQAWWLFREPLLITCEEERQKAARLTMGLVARLRAHWRSLGWEIDSTGDLARVLRCPGTQNRKLPETRPVEVVERSGCRYNPSEIEEWCETTITVDLEASREAIHAKAAGLLVSRAAAPPAVKLMALQATHSKFAATWARQRPDLADQSQSTYDMALAAIALGAGWGEQEAVDLMIAHRVEGGGAPKRPDYYAMTISKLAKDGLRARASEEIAERVALVQAGAEGAAEARSSHLRDLRALLGIEVCTVERYPGDPPAYLLRLPEGQISLGGVETLLKAERFHASVAAVAGIVLPRFKRPQWDTIAQALLQAAVDVDLGLTPDMELGEWLASYFLRYPPEPDRDKALATHAPWQDEGGRVHIRTAALRRHLRFEVDEHVTPRVLARMLRFAGAERGSWSWTTAKGARTNASLWRLPDGVYNMRVLKGEIRGGGVSDFKNEL